MSRSLLAHVVAKFAPRQWENIATEALRYLLQRPGVDLAVEQMLAPIGFKPGPLRWQSQSVHSTDSGRPDLVGLDDQDRARVIVEVKFWAELTEQQPLGYLARQERQFPDAPADHLLVFVVPTQRVPLIEGELQRRLGVPAAEATSEHRVFDRSGRRVLLLSWSLVLTHLQTALQQADDAAGLDDLRQLRGLCARADSEAMLPIAQEEVDARRGHRYFEFCELVDSVTNILSKEGLVDTRSLRASAGKGWYCRYVRHSVSGLVFGIGVYAWSWGNTYPSPWWIQFYEADPDVDGALERLRGDNRLPYIGRRDQRTEIALRPPTGREEHEVVRDLADSVRLVCAHLPTGSVGATDIPPDEPNVDPVTS